MSRTATKPRISAALKEELVLAKAKATEVKNKRDKYLQQLSRHTRAIASPKAEQSFSSTVIFAQEAAGSGICVSTQGHILTCAHCVDEDGTEEEKEVLGRMKFVIFTDGEIYLAKCVAVDFLRDCALLLVEGHFAAPHYRHQECVKKFPFVTLAERAPSIKSKLFCIGQPGREDLEADVEGINTDYDLVSVSSGAFQGLVKGDPHDNREIGKLKHTCWTYWGHSGAPLFSLDCEMVGIHSSWDDETAMRHGVPLEALKEFMKNLPK